MYQTVIYFPLAAILFSIIAYIKPELFSSYQQAIIPLLGLVMFGMGMTLKVDDFKRVIIAPKIIGLGLLLQFFLMPFAAWIISLNLNLSLPLMTGLVLVGACPGGTASNVICYLARGDVALSITLTSFSTLLAVILTPYLTWLYIGQKVPVPVISMILSILKIIILPVSMGVLINRFMGDSLLTFKKIFPVISMMSIVLIIAIIVAINATQLSQIVVSIIFAVILHNLIGLCAGYYVPRIIGFDKKICRTIAIEVGMQNSGLGVALANKYFVMAATIPGAIFSIWHNISGAVFAAYWAKKTDAKKES